MTLSPAPSLSKTPAAATEKARPNRLLVVILSFLIFVVLGMPDGMIGRAFPEMRKEFGLTLDAFGTLFVSLTAGFLISSFLVGRLLARFPAALVFAAAILLRALSLLGYVVLPTWAGIALSAFMVGLGSGVVDAGMNTYFAMRFSPRLMNWLHASFGLGATLGPLVLAGLTSGYIWPAGLWAPLDGLLTPLTAFLTGYTWRAGYGLMALLSVALAAAVLLTRRHWSIAPTQSAQHGVQPEGAKPASRVTVRQTLMLPAVWLGISVFFFYTGVELTAGNWSYSLLTEARNVTTATATLWTSLYWAAFTVGRIVFGFITAGPSVTTLLRGCMMSALVGVLLLTWSPLPWVGILGLMIIGFSVAPIFPLLVSETPLRLGAAHAQHAIGFQVGAAAAGIAVLPSLAGVLAERTSLESIPFFLIVINVALIVLHELMVRGHIADKKSEQR